MLSFLTELLRSVTIKFELNIKEEKKHFAYSR